MLMESRLVGWRKTTWEDGETPSLPVGVFRSVSLDVCALAVLPARGSVRCAFSELC